jgi:hypothetical protein
MWTRLDAQLSQRVLITDFGRELVIVKAMPGDAGQYQCTAVCPLDLSAVSSKILRLTVEGRKIHA